MTVRHGRIPSAGVILAAALALTATACSSSGNANSANAAGTPASSGGSSTAASAAASAGSGATASGQSLQDLVAAAEKEGSVTWYTANSTTDVTNIVAGFNKKYPSIKVNTLRESSDKMPSRVLTEQKGGKFNADVVGAEASYMAQMIQADAVVPYTPPDEAPLPSGLKIQAGFGNVDFVTTTVIVYNPNALKAKGLQPPTSFEDLTKPEWKGNFSVNPGALSWYDPLVEAMGHDKALQLAKALGANSPRLVESHTQAITQVQAGEPVATAMAYGYLAENLLKKTPGSIVIVNPNPLPAGYNLVEVAKNAPHPNAAKLLVDWIESQQGQQAIINATAQTSIRSDVQSDQAVWDPSKWAPTWENPSLPAATFNKYTQELQSAFKAS